MGRFSFLWLVAGALASPLRGAEMNSELEQGFLQPPDSARPWVYWFVMDGNLSREGITADFESLKRVGIGGVLFMEVDVGIPKGPVKFMSLPWRELFKHANVEAARLGLVMTMPASPGWTGSGGPWVTPEQSMQKLVVSETNLAGPQRFEAALPKPPTVAGFYRDVAVLAFPTPTDAYRLEDIAEKALYQRGHFSSEAGVKALLPSAATYRALNPEQVIARQRMVDLSGKLDAQGRLAWKVPPGPWTVLRFGHTSTGANTRPAPDPGLGLECDKLDKAALEAHFNNFLGKLLADIGPLAGQSLVSLHIDSWEMGPQNWTAKFREEFQKRRGYDLRRYLPVMTGRVVDSLEVSERFLWDVRQTVLELIADNHAGYLAALAHRHKMGLSIEPYDGTPCDDMTYGARADVPMGEFWRETFSTWFSCTEASSIAHTYGQRVVQAEAFTSGDGERWLAHPASLKTLGDWAFCDGINRFVFHRYAHQPWLDRWPGMTMGPYGIHYERTQTWFEQSKAWIEYLTRCQFLLQQGLFVADVCFLKPEASPQVFRPPASATRGDPPERLGYNFDGLTPEALLTRLSVKNGQLVLPDGMSYRVLVLPEMPAMTPRLLRQIKQLVEAGATVVGPRPLKSPSLSGYPQCDDAVKKYADELWGDCDGKRIKEHVHGKGRVVWARRAEPEFAEATRHPLETAKWIWHKEGNPTASAPVGKRYFRRAVTVEGDLESAHVFMTADNAFELWCNGRLAGTGNNFHTTYALDVMRLLKPGVNLLAVAAENGGDAPNPAGLIGTLVIKFRNGRVLEVSTDRTWQTARTPGDQWNSDVGISENWSAAMELGPWGMAPWGAIGKPASTVEAFGDFSVVASVLAGMGVPPDFESDGPLRYTHRRTRDAEIYFVANRDERWVAADCAFRVSGKVPEIWEPLTGRIKRPAVYREKDGRTLLPLWLEPAGSVFVVFRNAEAIPRAKPKIEPVVAVSRDGQNILPAMGHALSEPPVIELLNEPGTGLRLLAWQAGQYQLKTTGGKTVNLAVGAIPSAREIGGSGEASLISKSRLDALNPHSPSPALRAPSPPLGERDGVRGRSGSWEVRFQPNRGAPEKITLDSLTDWSKHADAGVKYFSGTANYRKLFTVPSEMLGQDKRLFLDLGRVQVLAQVKLNEKDLGVLWKTPFRVEITDTVKAGDNELEIIVANLWPNRLIGDQGLPPDQRVAWTTWNPFKQDSPLLESGLLGPVTLQSAMSVVVPSQ